MIVYKFLPSEDEGAIHSVAVWGGEGAVGGGGCPGGWREGMTNCLSLTNLTDTSTGG